MSPDRLWDCLRSLVEAIISDRPRRGRRPTRMRLEVLESRQVPTLTPVSATAGYPFTAMVKLFITYPDNRNFVGSGALVDSFHVLTAGHNIYSAADGGFARSIRVVPEMSGSYQPFGSAYMAYERTYTSFINYNRTHPGTTTTGISDIGLLTLDRNIGRYTGSMSYGYDDNNGRFAAGRVFNTAGYPATGGYDGSRMYFSSGAIAGLSGDGLGFQYYQSQITIFAGQSGSPVWEYTPSTGYRVILGVVVGGNNTPNSLNIATRITHAIFNDIGRWRATDLAPRSQFAGLGIGPDGGVGRGDAGAAAKVVNVSAGPSNFGSSRLAATTSIVAAPPASTVAHREPASTALDGGSGHPVGPASPKRPLALALTVGGAFRPVRMPVHAALGIRRPGQADAPTSLLDS